MKLSSKILDIIYVDDSSINHAKLSIIAEEFSTVNLVAAFSEAEKALDFCAVNAPDLAIIDIEMPGHNGIWLAEKLKNLEIEFVLLTSHNNYAAEAYKLGALHYLLKPLTKPGFAEVLQRYELKVAENNKTANHPIAANRLFVNTQKQIVVLQFSDIVYARAEGSYTYFQLANGQVIVSGKTLKTYINTLLQSPSFVKIHRAYIINQDHLEAINKKKQEMVFHFKTGHEIQVASFKKDGWISN